MRQHTTYNLFHISLNLWFFLPICCHHYFSRYTSCLLKKYLVIRRNYVFLHCMRLKPRFFLSAAPGNRVNDPATPQFKNLSILIRSYIGGLAHFICVLWLEVFFDQGQCHYVWCSRHISLKNYLLLSIQ